MTIFYLIFFFHRKNGKIEFMPNSVPRYILGKVSNNFCPFNPFKFTDVQNSLVTNKLQSCRDELGVVSLPGWGCGLVFILHSMKSCHPTSSHFVDCSFVCHKSEENEES